MVFSDGSLATVKTVIAGSVPKDLIILEVDTGKRSSVDLGNELQLKVGETIYAIGAPKGLSSSLSSGLISAFREDEGQFLIQITAPIAPSSSGGPLFDSQGKVVGVTTSKLKDGSFGFAVGVGDVQHLLKAPLGIKLQLSDLNSTESGPSDNDLSAVKSFLDQKKYDDASASFNNLANLTPCWRGTPQSRLCNIS